MLIAIIFVLPLNYVFVMYPCYISPSSLAQEGAEKILHSEWTYSEKHHKEYNRAPFKGLTIPEGQGSKELRCLVAQEMRHNVHCLSTQALRKKNQINRTLFQILRNKRLGHVISLKGEFSISDGKKMSLEGFHEVFSLAMQLSSFETFAKESGSSEILSKLEFLQKIFSHFLCSNTLSSERVEDAFQRIHSAIPEIQLIAAGFDWHSTQLIFFGNYFIYCNRGSGCQKIGAGWHLFKIGDKSKITKDWIHHIADRMAHGKKDHLSVEKIIEELQAEPIFSHRMGLQSVGTCTYASLKAAIHALLVISGLASLEAITKESCEKATAQGTSIYKRWTSADRQVVLSDFLIDLKAEPKDPGVFEVAKLIHEKLLGNPCSMFKIGCDLYVDLMEACTKVLPGLPEPTSYNSSLEAMANFCQRSEENHFVRKIEDQELIGIAALCIPESEHFYFVQLIINELYSRKRLDLISKLAAEASDPAKSDAIFEGLVNSAFERGKLSRGLFLARQLREPFFATNSLQFVLQALLEENDVRLFDIFEELHSHYSTTYLPYDVCKVLSQNKYFEEALKAAEMVSSDTKLYASCLELIFKAMIDSNFIKAALEIQFPEGYKKSTRDFVGICLTMLRKKKFKEALLVVDNIPSKNVHRNICLGKICRAWLQKDVKMALQIVPRLQPFKKEMKEKNLKWLAGFIIDLMKTGCLQEAEQVFSLVFDAQCPIVDKMIEEMLSEKELMGEFGKFLT